MKKLLLILSIVSIMLCTTSCMRGGNVDKGDDGRIGYYKDDTALTDDRHNDKHDTTDNREDRRINDDRIDRRIEDTYDEFATDVERLPSRIRNKTKNAVDDMIPDGIRNDMHRDIK